MFTEFKNWMSVKQLELSKYIMIILNMLVGFIFLGLIYYYVVAENLLVYYKGEQHQTLFYLAMLIDVLLLLVITYYKLLFVGTPFGLVRFGLLATQLILHAIGLGNSRSFYFGYKDARKNYLDGFSPFKDVWIDLNWSKGEIRAHLESLCQQQWYPYRLGSIEHNNLISESLSIGTIQECTAHFKNRLLELSTTKTAEVYTKTWSSWLYNTSAYILKTIGTSFTSDGYYIGWICVGLVTSYFAYAYMYKTNEIIDAVEQTKNTVTTATQTMPPLQPILPPHNINPWVVNAPRIKLLNERLSTLETDMSSLKREHSELEFKYLFISEIFKALQLSGQLPPAAVRDAISQARQIAQL